MTAKKKPTPIREGAWAGYRNYECTRCSFKSLDREAVVLHIIEKHAVTEATK